MAGFNAQRFIDDKTDELRKVVGDEAVLAAVSGGVDSSTAAALVQRAIGRNVSSVFIDTGFMRIREPERIVEALSSPPLSLAIEVIKAQRRFLERMKRVPDAERKRKLFRSIFYDVLAEEAGRRGCGFLVQGTIAPDWIETRQKIKTQHNVLSQVGIDPARRYGFKVLEPLAELYKFQVREVAKALEMHDELFRRQPFPGPGLSVRVVGAITEKKLQTLKVADLVVTEHLDSEGCDQYFAAVLDGKFRRDSMAVKAAAKLTKLLDGRADRFDVSVFTNKATGIRAGARRYGEILAVSLTSKNRLVFPPVKELVEAQRILVDEFSKICHVLVEISRSLAGGRCVAAIRAVQTKDFMTAQVSELDAGLLVEASQKILKECPEISRVYYDVTPKPPATIEFE